MDETETELSKPAFESSASLDYMRWLTEKDPDASVPKNKLRHQELIDSFIESGNERIRRLTPEQVEKGRETDRKKPKQEKMPEPERESLDNKCGDNIPFLSITASITYSDRKSVV